MIAAITGLIAGLIHVLTGPDHLTAIAPLAVRRPKAAWIPGVRWGLGHSSGVAVVGLLALWLRDKLPVDLLSSWGDRIVGVVLFGIGLWALRRALKHNVHAHEHEHHGERHVHFHVHHHPAQHRNRRRTTGTRTRPLPSAHCTGWRAVRISWAYCPCWPCRPRRRPLPI